MSHEPSDAGNADADTAQRDARFEPDAQTRAFLRDTADDIRSDTTESKQVAALLYRVSDLYDPDEDTDPRDIYVNMREILRVKEQGGMDG